MSYIEVNNTNLDPGKAVTSDVLQQINNNIIDHEGRLNSVETVTGALSIWNDKVINAAALRSTGVITGLDLFQVPQDIILTTCIITSLQSSATSGTLEIDVLVSNNANSSFTTVFSTKPSIAFGDLSGSETSSSNAVFATTSISANQWLRLDVTGFFDPQSTFHILLSSEVS